MESISNIYKISLKNHFYNIVFLFFTFFGFNTYAQISHNFNSLSDGNITSSVSSTNMYQSGGACGNVWKIDDAGHNGSQDCGSPCSGKLAVITYTTCDQDEILYTDAFTPNSSSISIYFDYRFNHYSSGSNGFQVYF